MLILDDNSLQLYREADLHEEKDRISRSLGATRDPNLIQRVLQFAMSVSIIGFVSLAGIVVENQLTTFFLMTICVHNDVLSHSRRCMIVRLELLKC